MHEFDVSVWLRVSLTHLMCMTTGKIISTFSTIQSNDRHDDGLPFFCACLAAAAAACFVFMSVNAFSESALGILSKEEREYIITQ